MGDLSFLLPNQKEVAMELMQRSTLPETGFLRLPQIVGDSKAQPPVPALIPVSRSTWWAGVKSGRYPRPVKLGPRITAWRVEDIRRLILDTFV
jgi:predicted DNA-binding transcriptional regulator AlpA